MVPEREEQSRKSPKAKFPDFPPDRVCDKAMLSERVIKQQSGSERSMSDKTESVEMSRPESLAMSYHKTNQQDIARFQAALEESTIENDMLRQRVAELEALLYEANDMLKTVDQRNNRHKLGLQLQVKRLINSLDTCFGERVSGGRHGILKRRSCSSS